MHPPVRLNQSSMLTEQIYLLTDAHGGLRLQREAELHSGHIAHIARMLIALNDCRLGEPESTRESTRHLLTITCEHD